MRHDAPVPALIVLDLLARADALAIAATEAIVTGDDARLAAVLEDRGVVINAVANAWRDTVAHPPTPDQARQIARAATLTESMGQQARATAILARNQVVTELSLLDARQQASHEYHPGTPLGTIDVVL